MNHQPSSWIPVPCRSQKPSWKPPWQCPSGSCASRTWWNFYLQRMKRTQMTIHSTHTRNCRWFWTKRNHHETWSGAFLRCILSHLSVKANTWKPSHSNWCHHELFNIQFQNDQFTSKVWWVEEWAHGTRHVDLARDQQCPFWKRDPRLSSCPARLSRIPLRKGYSVAWLGIRRLLNIIFVKFIGLRSEHALTVSYCRSYGWPAELVTEMKDVCRIHKTYRESMPYYQFKIRMLENCLSLIISQSFEHPYFETFQNEKNQSSHIFWPIIHTKKWLKHIVEP